MSQAGRVAGECATAEINRKLVQCWIRELDGIHRSLLSCLLMNVGVAAIEQWEKERPEREKAEFFGVKYTGPEAEGGGDPPGR